MAALRLDAPDTWPRALRERCETIAHDLGKYVHFAARFALDESLDDSDLREALRADLWCTRRAGGRAASAWDLWAELRPAELAPLEEVRALDADLAELRTFDLDHEGVPLRRVAELAARVARTARALRRFAPPPEEL